MTADYSLLWQLRVSVILPVDKYFAVKSKEIENVREQDNMFRKVDVNI